MRLFLEFVGAALFIQSAVGQQIWDIWQTTWDRSKLFTSLAPSNPINFVSPGPAAAADINVDDSTVYQSIWGFGGTFTDSTAELLNNLKNQNSGNYYALLNSLFDPTDGAQSAGLTLIRVPIGATDFSAKDYSFDDTSGDTGLNNFNANNAPSYVYSVLSDIQSINPYLRIILTPWSPPAWMKSSNTMNGGSLTTSLVSVYANYLLKAVQAFKNKGIVVYAVSPQNEPENSNGSYPTCSMPVNIMAQIGSALRTLLNNNGFFGVKLIGYEHNWSDAAGYPVQLMQQAGSAFAGVSFHCYDGTYSDQASFANAFPSKEIYFTECTGSQGSDWWSDIKWYMDNLMIGALEYNAESALMWNIALDGNGNPELPGTSSCHNPPCRGIVTINSDGSYGLNQECLARNLAAGRQWALGGQRIGVTVGGSLSWALRVGAYVTGRVSSTDWLRYSIVVLNWDDSASTTWNPQNVAATIEFRGMQASYTFPVGVTTLWWYAPKTGASKRELTDIYVSTNGTEPRILPRVMSRTVI